MLHFLVIKKNSGTYSGVKDGDRMHIRPNRRRKQLLLFLFPVIILCAIGGRLIPRFIQTIRTNLAVRMYNGLIEIYMPQIMMENMNGTNKTYEDIAEMLFPAMSYSNEVCSYDGVDEGIRYEYLAAMENEQIGYFMQENENNLQMLQEGTQEDNTEEVVTVRDSKLVMVNREKLKDFDYLRQNFYTIDSSTTADGSLLNSEQFLSRQIKVEKTNEGPQILIYHTHSQEGYVDSAGSVMDIGEYLAQILREEYGYNVMHHTGEYDVGDREHAYSNAAPDLEKILSDNPSIQVVIDLHRDAVPETTHLVTEINGKQTAKIMFFNGLSKTTAQGNLAYLPNPNIESNLAFSFQMKLAAEEYYPGFTRKIYLKGYRYNMHYKPFSLLVEVGAQNNTFEEAKNAMEPLADILNKVLQGYQ